MEKNDGSQKAIQEESALKWNREIPKDQNRQAENKATTQNLDLQQNIVELLEAQIKPLFEMQNKQISLLREINFKLDELLLKL